MTEWRFPRAKRNERQRITAQRAGSICRKMAPSILIPSKRDHLAEPDCPCRSVGSEFFTDEGLRICGPPVMLNGEAGEPSADGIRASIYPLPLPGASSG